MNILKVIHLCLFVEFRIIVDIYFLVNYSWYDVAAFYANINKNYDALIYIQKALELDPVNSDLLEAKRHILSNLENYDDSTD